VGRAIDCDVVLHDPFVAPHHASLGPADDPSGLVITVGDSVNGVSVETQRSLRRLSSGASSTLAPGSVCHVGRSALRVRLAGEALAPEEHLDHPSGRTRFRLTVGALAALLVWIYGTLWLGNEPDAGWDKYLPILIGAMFGVAGWSALWGLGSKLFQRQFRIVPHLQVLLAFLLASLAADAALAIASFSLSWPWLSHVRGWVEIGIFAALLGTHVALVLPGRERRVAATFGALCLLFLGVDGALNWRHHQRVFDELYVATLPPPALRLAGARPISELVEQLRPLQARLIRQAQEDEERDNAAMP
jgi:hypothetical protein